LGLVAGYKKQAPFILAIRLKRWWFQTKIGLGMANAEPFKTQKRTVGFFHEWIPTFLNAHTAKRIALAVWAFIYNSCN
jgi:hypothetical protein